jgi:NAD+ synthase (glutamine-hydrolysing)
MSQVRVAAAALNQTPLAWEDNLQTIRSAIRAARKARAQVLCLPELCISGYGCEDAFHSEELAREALACAVELAQDSKGLVVNFGLPLLVQGVVYNAVAVAVDGKLCGFVAKQNLAGDGLHYEPRWFKPWPPGVVTSVSVGGRSLPVGDIYFEIDGVRIGFEICEDAWVADRPGFALAQHGVDIILNPSASHFAFGKQEIRKRFILEGSRACGAGYLYANLLGCEAGRAIYDGDTFIASHGEIVAQGQRFSFHEFQLTTAIVDIARSRLMRRQRVGFYPHFDAPERLIVVAGFTFRAAVGQHPDVSGGWERSAEIKHEEFTRAVCLGLFDYLRKSRSHGFVVSLSGGVDSSAVSCLVALMVRAACDELGPSVLRDRLAYIPWMKTAKGEKDILPDLLACVYQATRNSSATTHTAAVSLAREIGATFFDLDIDSLVTEYHALIEKATGMRLSWREHDVALQNIQARVRSPSVWLIANLRRALLLTTSNRSEASVGYTTMDGDSSGGLAPLGGIDKAYLREWLRWLEVTGPQGLCCFPSLALVNKQAPTAELRPPRARQTDEGDLMPYVVLDSIERRAIRDKLMPIEVWNRVCEEYRGVYSRTQVALWVERFFTLWSANQWKRERYAPSFHVDDENVDPKTWCRFPILSGGFRKELAALRKKVRGKGS